MDESDLAIMAGILAFLWLGVVVMNIIYLWGHVLDRSLEGPSPLPIVGSIFGVIALLAAPWGTLATRTLVLPVALLPDLMTLATYRWIEWVNRRGD